MLGYQTKCDGCGLVADHWPQGNDNAIEGWACVQFSNGNRFDYCPECWSTMFCSLIKSPGESAQQKGGATTPPDGRTK